MTGEEIARDRRCSNLVTNGPTEQLIKSPMRLKSMKYCPVTRNQLTIVTGWKNNYVGLSNFDTFCIFSALIIYRVLDNFNCNWKMLIIFFPCLKHCFSYFSSSLSSSRSFKFGQRRSFILTIQQKSLRINLSKFNKVYCYYID